jgi:hypothetical protein
MAETYRLEDAWLRHLELSVTSRFFWRRPVLEVRINGSACQVEYVGRRKGRHRYRVPVGLANERITSMSVSRRRGSETSELSERKGRAALLFEHSVDTLLEKVQRRGALTSGKGIQLACALQAYLWAVSDEGQSALNGAEQRLRARAVPLCSAAYRLIQVAAQTDATDVELISARASAALLGIDLDGPEARWFPSLQLAVAQLCLVKGNVAACVSRLMAISDEQERILKAEPICAFNVTLANCLLCAILDQLDDPRLERYQDRWQWVFRYYPPHMDIRFGTMEEFGRIYQGAMLNYRIELTKRGQADRRFKPATFDEVLDVCMRVKLSRAEARRVRLLVASYAASVR